MKNLILFWKRKLKSKFYTSDLNFILQLQQSLKTNLINYSHKKGKQNENNRI